MNFDDIKKQWDNDSPRNMNVRVDLEKVEAANKMLRDLLKGLKRGLISRAISIVVILIIPLLAPYTINGVVAFIYFFLVFYMLVTTAMNFIRYRHFIVATRDYEISSSKEKLLKVYYELKYFQESNVLTTIIDTPSGIGLLFILFSKENSVKYFDQLLNPYAHIPSNSSLLMWTVLLVVCSLLFTAIIVYFFQLKYYDEKMKQIKEVLDDLEE